jgi:hypothetical protein
VPGMNSVMLRAFNSCRSKCNKSAGETGPLFWLRTSLDLPFAVENQ